MYLGSRLIAEDNTLTGTSYSHTDALGSPVARTNSAGQVTSRTRYEPYGATAAGTNPTGIGFTGHVNDADTGLVYMQQRYYEPLAGRFLSVDPVVTEAKAGKHFNRYAYADSNPYKYTDPDGRSPAHAVLKMLDLAISIHEIHAAYASGGAQAAGRAAVEAATSLPGSKTAKALGRVVDAVKDAGRVGDEAATVVRTTRSGDTAIRITNPDGSVVDISAARVKEFVPNTHPNAPPGTLDKVKFEEALPGSKGYKRAPTEDELKRLEDAKKESSK